MHFTALSSENDILVACYCHGLGRIIEKKDRAYYCGISYPFLLLVNKHYAHQLYVKFSGMPRKEFDNVTSRFL